MPRKNSPNSHILYKGRHLWMLRTAPQKPGGNHQSGGWEFARRPKISGIVGIVAITDDQKLLLVEQFRPPLNCRVLEIPAGLAGDGPQNIREKLAAAARRELREETGYRATHLKFLADGPPSAGLSDEIISFFLATGLQKVAPGGGDASEAITVYEIPIAQVEKFIRLRRRAGVLADLKLYAALFWATQNMPMP